MQLRLAPLYGFVEGPEARLSRSARIGQKEVPVARLHTHLTFSSSYESVQGRRMNQHTLVEISCNQPAITAPPMATRTASLLNQPMGVRHVV